MNRSCFLSCAASAHTVQPLGHAFPVLCRWRVWTAQCSPWAAAFPPQPPPGLAPSLFGWFIGTSPQSDSSAASMPALWLCAFAVRPAESAGTTEVSRFSCMLFLQRARGLTTTGDSACPRDDGQADVAFPCNGYRSASPSKFSKLNTRPTSAPVYASTATSRSPPQNSGSGWFATPFL